MAVHHDGQPVPEREAATVRVAAAGDIHCSEANRDETARAFAEIDGDVLVDVIFRPRGLEMTDEVFARAETREVLAISVTLMALEDVFATKLMSIDEHSADYSGVLLMARSLRERIDWAQLRERTAHSPFAQAFFVLCEGLGVGPAAEEAERARATSAGRAAVRVVDP